MAGLDHGADDYVTKPFSIRELSARVRAALRRAANADSCGPPAARSKRSSVSATGSSIDLPYAPLWL